MRSFWQSVRRFLTAEEVPRWFGLSIVLIYLVGLGAISRYGIARAREDGAVQVGRDSLYAMKLLAKHLSSAGSEGMAVEDTDRTAVVSGYRRALLDFAAAVPVRWIRIVDANGRVLAVTPPRSPHKPWSDSQPVPAEGVAAKPLVPGVAAVPVRTGQVNKRGLLARVRIGGVSSGASDNESDGQGALFVEAHLTTDPLRASGPANRAAMLSTVLIVLGALFVVYRCLREQLRGVSRIANRLQLPRDRLEDDLKSLRIGDTLDNVTTSWNELIDLTGRLLETVQRSEADEELSHALNRSSGGALAEALSAVPDGIIYITEEVRFEYVNSTARRLLGWNKKEVENATLPTVSAAGVGGKILDLLRKAVRPDGSFEGRTVTYEGGEDGSVDAASAYRIRIFPLRRGHHQGECVLLVRDISQQVRAEKAREEFITQVTHELRTPLTNIRAYAETLSSGMFDDPSVITECYNVITKETRRLSRLVEDILSVSQLEVGTIELQVSDVDLKTLLGEAVRDLRGLADEKNIDVQLKLPSKIEPLRGDRDKLAVVMNNLLGNAIKYTPSAGQVVVGCQFTHDAAVISIKDYGIGIDPEDHGLIFEKFRRANDPGVKNQTGTGIGLYTAREVVRRHRGEIELISRKGEGATFLVRLPRQASRDATVNTRLREA